MSRAVIQCRTLARLVRAVAVLSWPASDQLAYLQRLERHIDELALELHDEVQLIDELVSAELIDDLVSDAVRRVDGFLDSMSGHENTHLWTHDALLDSAEWEQVRQLAREAILEIR